MSFQALFVDSRHAPEEDFTEVVPDTVAVLPGVGEKFSTVLDIPLSTVGTVYKPDSIGLLHLHLENTYHNVHMGQLGTNLSSIFHMSPQTPVTGTAHIMVEELIAPGTTTYPGVHPEDEKHVDYIPPLPCKTYEVIIRPRQVNTRDDFREMLTEICATMTTRSARYEWTLEADNDNVFPGKPIVIKLARKDDVRVYEGDTQGADPDPNYKLYTPPIVRWTIFNHALAAMFGLPLIEHKGDTVTKDTAWRVQSKIIPIQSQPEPAYQYTFNALLLDAALHPTEWWVRIGLTSQDTNFKIPYPINLTAPNHLFLTLNGMDSAYSNITRTSDNKLHEIYWSDLTKPYTFETQSVNMFPIPPNARDRITLSIRHQHTSDPVYLAQGRWYATFLLRRNVHR